MPEDEDVVRTVYLTGQPGSGKTELARQYGEQFKNETSPNDTSKPLVITLNGNSEESLLKSVKEATRKLRLPVRMELTNDNIRDLMKNLRVFFHEYSDAWLLIIDDLFGNDFNGLFPRPGGKEWGGGQVLITTQDNNLLPACGIHQFAKKLSLNEGMTKEDALALLKENSDVEIDDFAEEIIKELQYLPLPLACCATHVMETRQDRASTQFGWKEYLNLYRANAKLKSRTFSDYNAYPFSMTTASTMAVQRMAETSDVLRLTFSFLSYCALLPVPLNLLAHHVKENLPKENEILDIQNEIARCTLLVRGRSQNLETIKCHQVIHSAFRSVENTNPDEQREIEFVKMMKSLNETLDFMDNMDKEDVLLKVVVRPHLETFVGHANDMSWNNTVEFVLISMKNSQFLFSTSDMPDDDTVKSLELLNKIFSELDLSEERRCDIMANLGFYYLELDREEDAWNFLSKAYCMTEDKTEKEWLLLRCRISYNLARTYYNMDSVDLAVKMMKRSIDLAKKVYTKEEDKIMNRFYWLAKFQSFPTKFCRKLEAVVEEAEEFLSGCTPDSESLSRAGCLDQLARVYMLCTDSKYTELAKNYFSKSMNMYERVLGEDVFSCPEYCVVLAWSAMFKFIEKPTEARTQLEKALEYCIQNGDMFNYSLIRAIKKRLLDDSSWWQSLFYSIQNLTNGRLASMFDDILEDYNTGKISPSRRMINSIKRERNRLIWLNYEAFFLAILVLFNMCIIFYI